MKLSHFFIDRPVFAAVLAILITLVGAVAYPNLPIDQYPNIAPPTVTVTATYPGATAETLADTVSDPIEEQINGVDNMLYMSSQSTGDGHVTITVTFKLGTNVDIDQVLVANRVTTATPRLPAVVVSSGVVVRKASPDIVLAVHTYSPDRSLNQTYISNYIGLHVRDELLRLPGVGDIGSRAARDYSMRIWIDPDRASARNLTVEEILDALRSHNVQIAAGALGQPPQPSGASAFQVNVDAQGRLSTAKEFGDIIIKTDAGRPTRVSDIARVEMGAADYTIDGFLNRDPAVSMVINPQPGANTVQVADEIKAKMAQLSKAFPPGLAYKIVYNPTDYVKASISAVEETLFEALALVVIVIIIFLQSWRAALAPIVAIPVSLIGTFAVMSAFGFTLNNLSLFGLVLAIGIVVDDAIVVVENVERLLRQGLSPRDAAHTTMDEVGGALIAIALVLIAVFVPTAFITGISGQFYRQFALTIATATVISLIVSLTLSPALAALIMKPHVAHDVHTTGWRKAVAGFSDAFNGVFDRLSHSYSGLTQRLVRFAMVMLIIYGGLLGLTVWRLAATPRGFIPAQDQGALLIMIALPPGAALQRSDAVAEQVVDRIIDVKGVRGLSVTSGVDATTNTTASNGAQIYVVLDPSDQRLKEHLTPDGILADLRMAVAPITGADIRVIQPPPVRGIGTTGGFKMIVENQSGASPRALEAAVNDLADAANKSDAVTNAFATFNTRTPRIHAEIDRDKAEILGVSDSAVFDTLQTYLGSTYVNDFNLFGRTFQVFAQADAPFRGDPSQINELRTRSSSGAMVPLGSVINLQPATGPYRVLRYNLYPAAEIQGEAKPGYSSGQAMEVMERLAHERLPSGFGFEWTELSYQERLAGNTGIIIFGLAVVFVFLLLAALYESVTLPAAVILIVPMCLLAAISGVNLRGMDNNILTQIGLVVLIGLAAKNAILIVEFARQGEEEHGLNSRQAAVAAARTRLRPILMTSFAFIFGVAPLAFAQGAGFEMRQALGVAVFFGMIGVTVFGLLFTPSFYVLARAVGDRLPKPSRPPPKTPTTGGAPGQPQPEDET